MPPLGIFGTPKGPPVPPRPTPQTWGELHDEDVKRMTFIKYLLKTHRLGRDDMEAAP